MTPIMHVPVPIYSPPGMSACMSVPLLFLYSCFQLFFSYIFSSGMSSLLSQNTCWYLAISCCLIPTEHWGSSQQNIARASQILPSCCQSCMYFQILSIFLFYFFFRGYLSFLLVISVAGLCLQKTKNCLQMENSGGIFFFSHSEEIAASLGTKL